MSTRGMFNLLSTNFNIVNPNLIAMEEALSSEDVHRLRKYMSNWNFYNGYHWEDIPATDKPEVTENWCRRFVNKFVEAEFNPGFTVKMDEEVESIALPFLQEVWEDNAGERLMHEIGQMKSVTGDAYLHVIYEPKFVNGYRNPNFEDPFDLYEKGRIKLVAIPSSICYPKFKDGYDMYAMESCTVLFPVRREQKILGASIGNTYDIIKYVYTKDTITVYRGMEMIKQETNPYGIIPIVHFKNLPLAGAHFGVSDLEDIIPLNTELNLKNSDVSDILDYHSAPLTIVYGARVGQLDRGANKVWGGLPKDGKVENLTLNSDLAASQNYRDGLRKSMFQIGSIPEIAMGGDLSANISGVALSIAFMPLTDVIKDKMKCTKVSLRTINQIILKIAKQEGLLADISSIPTKKLYSMEIVGGDLLPKDKVQELEQMQQELKMGLDSRKNMMKRLKKSNIEELVGEIDEDRNENPELYGVAPVILSAGQKLFNPVNGEEIASNDKDLEMAKIQEKQQQELAKEQPTPRPTQLPNKPVGTNSEGKQSKINSGVMNTNPKS